MKKNKIIEKGIIRPNWASSALPFQLHKQELADIRGGNVACDIFKDCSGSSSNKKSICKGGYFVYCMIHQSCPSRYTWYPNSYEVKF